MQQIWVFLLYVYFHTPIQLKTKDCAEAWNPENLSNKATRAIKKAVPNIAVMTDVALDPYSIDGHDGFVKMVVSLTIKPLRR